MRKLKLEELNRLSPEAFKATKKNAFILALDNIRSRNNVGSFFRTADAFRAKSLILGGISPVPPHRDIEKTAIGATQSVAWEHHENLLTYLKEKKEEGWRVMVVEQTDEAVQLNQFKANKEASYIFVFGNEVNGVEQTIVNLADAVLEIPQFGTKHSLNVAVSGGIVAWHYLNAIL